MPEYEKVIVKVGLFDFFEPVLQILNTVDGSICKDFVLSHMI